ncbi:MAG: hypothetical protein Q8K59_09300 [Nitrosomonas sp.]|nr:hypothetical protein [Nitrosomonas sp.]MDP1951271.1 hypothetical protein [Nitrosomonas sp.]
MVTKRGKQASRKEAARKYGFLEVPLKLVYYANRASGSYYPDSSLHKITMHFKIRSICSRFTTLLAKIT